jgi:hypothetical protein
MRYGHRNTHPGDEFAPDLAGASASAQVGGDRNRAEEREDADNREGDSV